MGFSIYVLPNYAGNVAPVGKTTKSNTMNSAVLVGWMNIWPTNWFLSMTSGVLLVSSMTTLKADKPLIAWTDSKKGFTILRNLVLVADVFCSNTKNLEEDAINFFNLINSLLTLTRSSADGRPCKVFCPHTHTPCPGNDAIGSVSYTHLTLPTKA